jgi:hypothetical protein
MEKRDDRFAIRVVAGSARAVPTRRADDESILMAAWSGK